MDEFMPGWRVEDPKSKCGGQRAKGRRKVDLRFTEMYFCACAPLESLTRPVPWKVCSLLLCSFLSPSYQPAITRTTSLLPRLGLPPTYNGTCCFHTFSKQSGKSFLLKSLLFQGPRRRTYSYIIPVQHCFRRPSFVHDPRSELQAYSLEVSLCHPWQLPTPTYNFPHDANWA